MRLARRLFAGFALVITVLAILVVAISGQRLARELTARETDQLTREAQLVATEWAQLPNADAEALAHSAGEALGHRVTLIAADGRVIGDSEFADDALPHLENHETRPEVVAAHATGTGVATRASPSRGDTELYVAVRSSLGVARVSVSTAQLGDIVSSARNDVLLSALIALAAALALTFAFSRAVTQPIVELRDVARSLAAGDLARRPSLSAPGEVGDLGTAMHRMAEQLAARLRELQAEQDLLAAAIESLHEGLLAVDVHRNVVRLNDSARRLLRADRPVPFSADVLPRDALLREALAAALAGQPSGPSETVIQERTLSITARPLGDGGAVLALLDLTATRRLEAVRRDFVANVSHELKTPLTVIGGFAETLVTDDLPAAQRTQFVEAIRVNAERMRRIVDDLLDLSRIESGGWRPNPSAVDVAAMADDIFSAAQRARADHAVSLETAIDPHAPTVYADPTALRQVLTNLIDNAIRYTPAGGMAAVFTALGDGGAGTWVGVRDSGIGIAPEHLSRIFERFYRVDPGRSRDAGGTGLGLAIVRHLVEAHAGRVEADSAPGRGTTVRAFFPAGPAMPSEAGETRDPRPYAVTGP
ncbi:MAG TPA: ATP-binding protein [Gemmatimonadaceae bacterium]|nr:ATP-binding protein [Gemmatimonadaceae bacterium]